MKRREFLAGLMAGGVVVAGELWIPGQKLISIPKTPNLIYGDKFAYDPLTKGIKYVGPKSESATVLELHRWLQDESDKIWSSENDILDITSPTPSIRITDHIIELLDGWHIKDHTAQYLTDGSIRQHNAEWVGIKTVGQIEDDSVVLINGIPAARRGHVNQCVKREDNITCSVSTPGNLYSTFNVKPQSGTNVAALCEGPDLFYNNPEDDPAFGLHKKFKYPFEPMTTSKAQRLGMKLK